MRYLAELLTRPGRGISALALVSGSSAPREQDRHELLDDTARAAYAARARDLRADLDEAEAHNDIARCERLHVELDAVVDELEAAAGLAGRPRAFTDSTERARTAVRKAIKRAIDAIDEGSPAIADLLRTTVSTGVTCVYEPDLRAPVAWTTSSPAADRPASGAELLARSGLDERAGHRDGDGEEWEPAELAEMRLKLAGTAAGLDHWSTWLAEKMAPAWEREATLLTSTPSSDAGSRFATLARTTRTGAALGLAARLLHAAVGAIAAGPLTSSDLRADPVTSDERLRTASWLLDEASSTLAEAAADLARSDPDWTAYLAALDAPPGRP